MRFTYAPIVDQHTRDAVFERMEAEGLTASAMSSLRKPTLAQWQTITAPERGVLLGCYGPPPEAASAYASTPAPLLACAMFSPRRGRVSEGVAFAEAMRQKVAATLFYGNSNLNPDEFNGLAMRYPALDAKNVLDAGGRDEDGCTSLWLVSWGAQSVHGVYPKESNGGLSHEDLKTYMAQDPDGRKYQVVGDKYNWRCGLAVRDWRGIVRIANLPVASLGKRKGQSGFVDMQKLTIEAKNLMPQHLRQKAVWYANADVLTALELQNSDAGNVQLQYGEFFDSKAVPVLHGRPVRQCDAVLSSEGVVA